jgi:four helix bundle protein
MKESEELRIESEEVGMSKDNAEVKKLGIVERTIKFSLDVIRLYRELEKDSVGRILGKQLLRLATSIGANVHEAQGGQSKADFIAKMSIAYKEARETLYRLQLIRESGLAVFDRLEHLLGESEQIIKILSSILLTSKNKEKVSSNSSLLTFHS